MAELEFDRFITDGLLAYFRAGESFEATAPPTLAFAGSRRLLRLHWAFGSSTKDLLEHLLRRHGEISASSTSGVELTTGSIRGPCLWPATLLQRRVTGNPSLVQFRDMRRTLDLGPNRVLQTVISNASQALEPYVGRRDLAETPYALSIRHVAGLTVRARRVMGLRGLVEPIDVHKAREPSVQDLMQASRSSKRLYVLAAKAYQVYRDIALNRLNGLREMLLGTLVAPLYPWQRFELFTVLHLALALHRLLGQPAHLHDLTGAMGGPAITVGDFEVYWGVRPPSALPPRTLPLRRRRIEAALERFGLQTRSGRSDICIARLGQSDVLAIVECKYSVGESGQTTRQFREALNQVMDYVEDYHGDSAQRLTKSAIVMPRLPNEVVERGGVAGPDDLIALSAGDLLGGSDSLQEWLRRVSVARVQIT